MSRPLCQNALLPGCKHGYFCAFVKIEMEGIARLKFADGARWCVRKLGRTQDGSICRTKKLTSKAVGAANFVEVA